MDLRDLPGGPVVKNLPCNVGDSGSVLGQGTRIPHATGQLSPRATTRESMHRNKGPSKLQRTVAPELTPDHYRVPECGHLDPQVLIKLSDDCSHRRGQSTHQIANPQNHKTQPALRYTQPLRFGVVCYTTARAQIIINTVKTKVPY